MQVIETHYATLSDKSVLWALQTARDVRNGAALTEQEAAALIISAEAMAAELMAARKAA